MSTSQFLVWFLGYCVVGLDQGYLNKNNNLFKKVIIQMSTITFVTPVILSHKTKNNNFISSKYNKFPDPKVCLHCCQATARTSIGVGFLTITLLVIYIYGYKYIFRSNSPPAYIQLPSNSLSNLATRGTFLQNVVSSGEHCMYVF